MFEAIVIGKGLIGTAAARYLSQMGLHTAVIGPDEPADQRTHTGVFASHYDQGRITRILDSDRVWATLAKRAMAAYADLEARSGIVFHHPIRGLRIMGVPGDPAVARITAVGRSLDAPFETPSAAELKHRFPFFDFPADVDAFVEHGPAGYINPRSLVAAQLAVAQQQGAEIVVETAVSLQRHTDHWTVTTSSGAVYEAPKVLVAAGAYTNSLLPRPLVLHQKAATILLAEIDPAEQARLAGMPTLIYKFPQQAQLRFSGIYLLPPVRYPNGRVYLKLGGTFEKHPQSFGAEGEIVEWFHGAGDAAEAAALKQALHSVLPDLRVVGYETRPCILAYTAHDHPYIDCVDEGVYIAAGGCGSAAKSSNEIGRLGAWMTAHGRWRAELAAADFQAVFC